MNKYNKENNRGEFLYACAAQQHQRKFIRTKDVWRHVSSLLHRRQTGSLFSVSFYGLFCDAALQSL
jgi:hypothetical protein